MSATCDDVLLMEGSTNAPGTGNGSRHPGFFLNNERQKGFFFKKEFILLGKKMAERRRKERERDGVKERERKRE